VANVVSPKGRAILRLDRVANVVSPKGRAILRVQMSSTQQESYDANRGTQALFSWLGGVESGRILTVEHQRRLNVDMTEQKGSFVQSLSAHPTGDFVVALTGVA
jgi:hypothetical protein